MNDETAFYTKLLSQTAMSNLYTMGITGQKDPRQTVPGTYTMPDQATRQLRAQLILEEALETIRALGFEIVTEDIHCLHKDNSKECLVPHPEGPSSLGEIIDGCCDLNYVSVGTLCACGAPDERHLAAVCRANNAKFPGGKAIIDANGKYQKPLGWVPPNHDSMIKSCYMNLKLIQEDLLTFMEVNR